MGLLYISATYVSSYYSMHVILLLYMRLSLSLSSPPPLLSLSLSLSPPSLSRQVGLLLMERGADMTLEDENENGLASV